MFLWFCPMHGHCYGFHIIEGAEGRKDAFDSAYKYMEEAPEELYYDYSFSLNEYCLNREPAFLVKQDSRSIFSILLTTSVEKTINVTMFLVLIKTRMVPSTNIRIVHKFCQMHGHCNMASTLSKEQREGRTPLLLHIIVTIQTCR